MSIQRPKPDAIGKPDVFDDSMSPAQIANVETNASNLKDVLSAILSQMKRIMRGNNAGDWKDDPTVVARSLQDLNDAAVMPNPTGTDGRAITEEGSVAAYRNVKASALLGGFQSVANAAARDAIPAGQRVEGMLVRTNDNAKLWVLDAGLTTWTEPQKASRFFTGATPQLIYVDPGAGSDTTGDGLGLGTAYQTIQRAIDDIPTGFTKDVIIQLASGSFSGQNTSVVIAPGFNATTNTSSQIYVVGERTPVFTTGTTGSGALVAGKTTQMQYSGAGVAHGLTITDGSHWSYSGSAVDVPSSVRVLRASSTTDLIVVQSSTSAFSTRNLCAYNTTFTSTFRFGCHSLSVTDAPFVHLIGIKFNALGSITRVTFQGCNVSTGAASIVQDSNIFSGYWGTDVTLFDGNHGRRTTFNSVFAAKVFLNGVRSSLQQCVFASSPGAGHGMLNLGTTSTTEPPVQSTSPSGVRLVSAVDFEGTANGVNLAGQSYLVLSGNVSFALTGRAMILSQMSQVSNSAASTLSGTVTLPLSLRFGSRWNKGMTFSISNTLNPGQDISVGGTGGATVIAASDTAVDTTELCSYL